MLNHPIHYTRQWIEPDDIEAVTKTLESPFLTTGPAVARLEQELADLTGAAHAVVCANGTAALHLACMAAGMGNGDLGITSPLSFLASANCMEYCGAQADFLDIDPSTLCLSPGALEAHCRDKEPPKVVIPVDFAGTPADLPAFHKLAQKYGFLLIEDAAHSIGSSYTYNGEVFSCGSCAHTDMAVFSFHPAKTVTAGEGGAILTRDAELAGRLRRFRNHGMIPNHDIEGGSDGPWVYEMEETGYNYRITDLQCALLSSQLKKLNRFAVRRREIVKRYQAALRDVSDIILPPDVLGEDACPHLFPIQLVQGEAQRKAVYLGLKKDNIHCQIHYIPIHLQPYYRNRYHYKEGKCPQAELYYSRCLSIPLYPALTDPEVDFIIERLLALLK